MDGIVYDAGPALKLGFYFVKSVLLPVPMCPLTLDIFFNINRIIIYFLYRIGWTFKISKII